MARGEAVRQERVLQGQSIAGGWRSPSTLGRRGQTGSCWDMEDILTSWALAWARGPGSCPLARHPRPAVPLPPPLGRARPVPQSRQPKASPPEGSREMCWGGKGLEQIWDPELFVLDRFSRAWSWAGEPYLLWEPNVVLPHPPLSFYKYSPAAWCWRLCDIPLAELPAACAQRR